MQSPARQLLRRPNTPYGAPKVSKPVTRQQVLQMISARMEPKFSYGTTGATGVTTSGILTRMTGMAQAIGQSARTGDEVNLKSFQFSYTATVGATGLVAAADQYNVVRLILFRYHLDDAIAVPVVASVISTSVTSNLTIAPLNRDNSEQYTILYDENIVLYNTPIWNGSATAWYHGVGGTLSYRSPVIQLKGKIQYSNAGVNGEGHVYALLVSDSAFTPNPVVEVVSTVVYTDA